MVTAHDVYYYLQAGRKIEEIRDILRLSAQAMNSAVRYIQENPSDVAAVYKKVQERIAKGNPPQIEAKRRESRAKVEAWLRERRASAEVVGEGHSGRQ